MTLKIDIGMPKELHKSLILPSPFHLNPCVRWLPCTSQSPDPSHLKGWLVDFYTLHKKVAGYYVIPSKPFWVSVCLSVRPFVSALFLDSNSSSFWPIFFKLCVDIDIGEEWFGIANGLNSFTKNRVMALDWCKNVFFLNIFRTNGWSLYMHWYIQDRCCI